SFYPFAPAGGTRRDNALELQVEAAIGQDLPLEKDRSRWFPVYGAPGLLGPQDLHSVHRDLLRMASRARSHYPETYEDTASVRRGTGSTGALGNSRVDVAAGRRNAGKFSDVETRRSEERRVGTESSMWGGART